MRGIAVHHGGLLPILKVVNPSPLIYPHTSTLPIILIKPIIRLVFLIKYPSFLRRAWSCCFLGLWSRPSSPPRLSVSQSVFLL